MPLNTIFLAILILIVVMLIISCVKIVRQAAGTCNRKTGGLSGNMEYGTSF